MCMHFHGERPIYIECMEKEITLPFVGMTMIKLPFYNDLIRVASVYCCAYSINDVEY